MISTGLLEHLHSTLGIASEEGLSSCHGMPYRGVFAETGDGLAVNQVGVIVSAPFAHFETHLAMVRTLRIDAVELW